MLMIFSGEEARVDRSGEVALATHIDREGDAFDGVLRPDEAVVLRHG